VCGLTGAGGGKLAPLCDTVLKVPSTRTARIQELHILAGHCCCELIDQWEAERVR
jgi:D-sedoheptulose 7-phosphate isomerase